MSIGLVSATPSPPHLLFHTSPATSAFHPFSFSFTISFNISFTGPDGAPSRPPRPKREFPCCLSRNGVCDNALARPKPPSISGVARHCAWGESHAKVSNPPSPFQNQHLDPTSHHLPPRARPSLPNPARFHQTKGFHSPLARNIMSPRAGVGTRLSLTIGTWLRRTRAPVGRGVPLAPGPGSHRGLGTDAARRGTVKLGRGVVRIIEPPARREVGGESPAPQFLVFRGEGICGWCGVAVPRCVIAEEARC